jgi:mono/diheme cytochrome c family protein
MRNRRPILLGLLLLGLAAGACRPAAQPTPPPPAAPTAPAHPLAWDAMTKTQATAPDTQSVSFSFTVTNTSDRALRIYDVRPSCGCSTVELPRTPWILAAGEKGTFQGKVDIVGKHGELAKMFYVSSIPGTQTLTLILNVPEPDPQKRANNQQLALADRQAVFRGTCAACHVEPAKGLMGAELFSAACAICHATDRRAAMVPDLQVARQPRDAAYWVKWISEGKEGTLMPAFSAKHGGPLNDEQVASLLDYVTTQLPSEPTAP